MASLWHFKWTWQRYLISFPTICIHNYVHFWKRIEMFLHCVTWSWWCLHPLTFSFTLLLHLLIVWHTVKLAWNHQTKNDAVQTGNFLPMDLYTHLILTAVGDPTANSSGIVVNIEHLTSQNNHLCCSIDLFS